MKDPAKHRDILKITAYLKTPKICNQTVKQNGILILGIHFWRAFNNLSYCAPFPSNVCEVTSLLTCVFVMGSSKKGWACHCIRAFNNTAAESSFEPSCSGILIPALLLPHTYVVRTLWPKQCQNQLFFLLCGSGLFLVQIRSQMPFTAWLHKYRQLHKQ